MALIIFNSTTNIFSNEVPAKDSIIISDTSAFISPKELPNITIIPKKKNNNDILNELPGSGAIINEMELKKLSVICLSTTHCIWICT